MNIPSPYFKDVPGIGNLELDEILVDYEYPLLSVLKSERGEYFLCMCYDVSGERESVVQRWAIVSITAERLKSLLQNEVMLISPFRAPEAVKILAEWKFSTKADSYRRLKTQEKFPERCLPAEDEYLDAEPDEWDDYIEKLNPNKIQADFVTHVREEEYPSAELNEWSNYYNTPNKKAVFTAPIYNAVTQFSETRRLESVLNFSRPAPTNKKPRTWKSDNFVPRRNSIDVVVIKSYRTFENAMA